MVSEKIQMPSLAGRPEATRAAQYVVRMIQQQGLKRGDRVPSQQELCSATGFSNNPMSAAMKVLVANGMLTRKVRVGTVILDPNCTVRGLWRVGVTILPATAAMPYYGELFHRVQAHLQNAGCITYSYLLNLQKNIGGSTKLEHFDYLPEDLVRRPLDGILDLTALFGEDWEARRKAGVLIAHAGSWESVPAGVLIEQGQMVHEAVRILVERGCRNLGVVSMHGPSRDYNHFWNGFAAGLASAQLPTSPSQSLHGGEGPIGGRNVADALLRLPRHKRPDGLIVVDDRIAMGLAATLVQTDYRPRLAVQTNLQAPLAYALPVLHFEVDAEELASRSVGLLMSYLRDPGQPPRQEWVHPKLLNPVESHMSDALK